MNMVREEKDFPLLLRNILVLAEQDLLFSTSSDRPWGSTLLNLQWIPSAVSLAWS
jgi:hypothetical protein